MTSHDFEAAAAALRRGDVVILNTETLPGLHTAATAPEAAQSLTRIKGSVSGRPFLLLFADAEEVFRYAQPADVLDADRLERAWPGPLTALLTPRRSAPAHWIHEGRSLAARVPQAESLRELIAAVGSPLFSTSANRAGQDPATSLDEAREIFPDQVAAGLGITPLGMPSTVVDLCERPARILRPGAVAWPPPSAAKTPGMGPS
jgi:L-threonylcarbamoyladenylate synthase